MILDSIRQGVQQDYSGGVGKVPGRSVNPAGSIDISDTRISSPADDSA